jgi:hypothetical protein
VWTLGKGKPSWKPGESGDPACQEGEIAGIVFYCIICFKRINNLVVKNHLYSSSGVREVVSSTLINSRWILLPQSMRLYKLTLSYGLKSYMISRRPIGEREAIRHAAAIVGKLRAYT